ncbi:MAG: hypothetical protein ACLT5V_07640 [Enterococcus avium]
MNKLKKKEMETPYLSYGVGYEEDERQNDHDSFSPDVLDLAEFLDKKYPSERISIMHNMFLIGFRCGQRCERKNKNLRKKRALK